MEVCTACGDTSESAHAYLAVGTTGKHKNRLAYTSLYTTTGTLRKIMPSTSCSLLLLDNAHSIGQSSFGAGHDVGQNQRSA